MIPYIISGLAVIALLVLMIYHISYRRQVEELSRQIEFINQNKTQMRMTTDISSKELLNLTKEVNFLKTKLEETKTEYRSQDEALRETITNLSHDIRTPLTSLDGYLQFLGEEGLSEEKRKYYLDIINNRVKSLNEMLNELFTYAKLQDRGYSIEMSQIDVAAVTADILVSFYDDLAGKGSEPKINIPEEHLMAVGNREAYTRVVQNIIKNALMHGKDLKVFLTRENEEILFSCSDTMLNPDQKVDIARIFDRFYKADPARNQRGSGLGLAISKELVERMGGSIGAECKDGEFTVNVRLKAADPERK